MVYTRLIALIVKKRFCILLQFCMVLLSAQNGWGAVPARFVFTVQNTAIKSRFDADYNRDDKNLEAIDKSAFVRNAADLLISSKTMSEAERSDLLDKWEQDLLTSSPIVFERAITRALQGLQHVKSTEGNQTTIELSDSLTFYKRLVEGLSIDQLKLIG
jgi:hypothetical protein